MRALVALTTLAACVAHAHQLTRDAPYHNILSPIGTKGPIKHLLTCSQSLGPTKCLTALSAWRAKKAIEYLDRGLLPSNTSNIEQFPWEEYSNTSSDQINTQLCEGTEKLLHYKTLSFTMIPGYRLELKSKENGKINVDVLKNEITTARGSKLKKQFYNIVPILLIPGLIMAAVLPFVLPAMKLATVATVMLNNMALTGAVFTLLRDNAFNDHSRPKVKYINAGWKNEEELYHVHEHEHSDYEAYSSDSNIDSIDHDFGNVKVVGDYSQNEHTKLPEHWLKNYKDHGDHVELSIQYEPHKRRRE
ncbi:uncharacterized protein LOC128676572 [Plodia interpunctella]|uniref:uncharacterized protein LOC128676572 n=1 Tax=Plodia interpunctella TaxID=58824 RepID=UPI0023678755|nr:uncharacterized protein LOC128676572 [Plodia interpunctella]